MEALNCGTPKGPWCCWLGDEKVKGARGRCDRSFKLYQELREGRGSAGNLEALLAPGDKPETNRRSQKM